MGLDEIGLRWPQRWLTILNMSKLTKSKPKPKTPNRGAKHKRSTANPDHSRQARTHVPAPPDPEVEARLHELVTPAIYAQLHHYRRLGMRDRLLTLPLMVALVLTMLWRRVPGVRTLVRMLDEEHLLWADPTRLSQSALSQRFLTFPAQLFAGVFEAVIEQLPARVAARQGMRPLPAQLAALQGRFSAFYALDGSTLDALFRKLGALREQAEAPLGGHMVAGCDLFTHLPTRVWWSDDAAQNDKSALPGPGGVIEWVQTQPRSLSVLDMGFFSFPFFDSLTAAQCYFVTRLRQKSRYEVEQVLWEGACVRDRIVRMGLYRSNPCRHPLRLVEVCLGGVWYQYLTNVLDPSMLSIEEVVQTYAYRWRIETAFLTTKRLLDLSYLWVGSNNGVELQVWGTWLFYAVLIDLCDDVAAVVGLPLERISVEMVYRGLYHYVQAVGNGYQGDVLSYYAQGDRAQRLGIIKQKRKRAGPTLQQQVRACLLAVDADICA